MHCKVSCNSYLLLAFIFGTPAFELGFQAVQTVLAIRCQVASARSHLELGPRHTDAEHIVILLCTFTGPIRFFRFLVYVRAVAHSDIGFCGT